MKGVILAGGLGTRLHPLTKITNKHLLPVYNQPMIYYPINTLVQAGIREIVLVTGGHFAGHFLNLLGNGIISPCDQSDARNRGLQGLRHTKTLYVETTTTEQARHP